MTTTIRALRDALAIGEIVGDDVVVRGITRDSREVVPGDLFVALPGEHHRGEAFIADAVARGAAAVMACAPAPGGVPTWVVDDPQRVLGPAAELVRGHPTRALVAWGVTGTNGKTTISHLLVSALSASGRRPAQIGTGALRFGERLVDSPFTTPFGDTISRFARECLDAGATDLVMEVSSHALAQHRADGVAFDVAGFTNLTQDHLDYHETLEAYGEAKARLFLELAPRSAINVDDAFGAALAERVGSRAIRVSARGAKDAEVRATDVRFHRDGIAAEVETPIGRFQIESPLVGAHNLENLLVAVGMAVVRGEPAEVVEALGEVGAAKGRLEPVEHPGGVRILVDYAHTPDALRVAIEAIRPFTPGRVIVVFGCGGDRDRGKRPLMGAVAAERAEVVVLTSDNPRTEDPKAILAAIEEGVRGAGGKPLAGDRGYVVVEDRAEAIALAIDLARAGDTVLIAGKGHETYQILGETKIPFDDREVARAHVERSVKG